MNQEKNVQMENITELRIILSIQKKTPVRNGCERTHIYVYNKASDWM